MSNGSYNLQYPIAVDVFPTWQNDIDVIDADIVNKTQQQIIAIETEVGSNPSGSLVDLTARLAVSINNNGTLKPIQRKNITVTAGNSEVSVVWDMAFVTDTYSVIATPASTDVTLGIEKDVWCVVYNKTTIGCKVKLRTSGIQGSSDYIVPIAGTIIVNLIAII